MKRGNAHYWTNSELSDWRRCLRKSYLRNVLRLVPVGGGKIPEWSITGDLIHDPLAVYYTEGGDLVALGLMFRDQAIEDQKSRLVPNDSGEIPLPLQNLVTENIETINKSWELVELMLEGYGEWLEEEGADAGLTIISAEQEVCVPINMPELDGEHYLLGKLDMQVFDKTIDARAYIDHKSVQSFLDKEKTAHIDPQFLFYALLEYLMLIQSKDVTNPEWVDRGILNMLRKVKRTARSKPPFFKRTEVRHNRTELENMYVRTMGEILTIMGKLEALENGTDYRMLFPPNPNKDCSWDCQYFSLCPMMDDGSDYQGYINEAFTTGDPLARYDTIPQEV